MFLEGDTFYFSSQVNAFKNLNSLYFSEILLTGSVHEIRLIDDAFGKICNGVSDLSMHVRTLAAKLLGSMKLVSPKFLTQTLDKKLMSNMRRKVQ